MFVDHATAPEPHCCLVATLAPYGKFGIYLPLAHCEKRIVGIALPGG
jgi:hypothetical protein